MSEQPIDRRPLAVRVADALAEELRRGEWSDGMPGYRVVAERLNVSWRASREALKILEKRGVLASPRRGSSRRVLVGRDVRNPSTLTLLVVTSSTMPADADEQALLDKIVLSWAGTGGEVHFVRADLHRSRRPETTLRSWIRRHQATVLLMREPPRLWVRAAMAISLPVYFLGGTIPRERHGEVSGFAFSIEKAVAWMSAHLRSMGHRRILAPDEGRGEEYRHAVLAGLRAGFEGEADSLLEEQQCPRFVEMNPEAWQRYWSESFCRFQPTAVIVQKEFAYLSLQGFCTQKGIRIPRDLSVVCLSSSGQLRWCHPAPDHIAFPNRKAINHFRRWMRNGFATTGLRLLNVEHVRCGTIMPVRKGIR